MLGGRKVIQQGSIALEMSLRGLLGNFGLKVGPISRGRFEHRIRELVVGNHGLDAATEPVLRARTSLRQELAAFERTVRQRTQAALLRKSAGDRSSPFPGHTHPAATVIGMPRAVTRFMNERQAPSVRARPRMRGAGPRQPGGRR